MRLQNKLLSYLSNLLSRAHFFSLENCYKIGKIGIITATVKQAVPFFQAVA
jgi:hypothetical protein